MARLTQPPLGRREMVRVTTLIGAVVASAIVGGTSGRADAQEGDSADVKLEILQADDIEVVVSEDEANLDVMLLNSGEADATGLSFALMQDNDARQVISLTPTSGGTERIEPGAIGSFSLAGDYDRNATVEGGVLTVTMNDEIVAQSAIAATQKLSPLSLALPIGGALVLAAAAVLLGGWSVRKRLDERLAKATDWEFGKSWASSISALGAILGTLLGASEIVKDAFPTTPLASFVGLNVLFGTIALLAPLVFLALQIKKDEGSVGGFLLASFLTLTAVSGQLLTLLAVFASADRGDKSIQTEILAVGIFLGLVLVVCYGHRSLKWRLEGLPPPGAVAPPVMPSVALI